jgi:hypothetical protein
VVFFSESDYFMGHPEKMIAESSEESRAKGKGRSVLDMVYPEFTEFT